MNAAPVNHVAVWLLAILHQVIAFVWYSPLLFSDKWVKLTGHSEADFANPSPLPFLISFVGAVVLCYVMAWLFSRLFVRTASRGLALSLIFWAGFLFFELVTFNAFELKPYELALINAGKSLVTFAVSGLVLGIWQQNRKAVYKPASYAKA